MLAMQKDRGPVRAVSAGSCAALASSVYLSRQHAPALSNLLAPCSLTAALLGNECWFRTLLSSSACHDASLHPNAVSCTKAMSCMGGLGRWLAQDARPHDTSPVSVLG